VENIPAFPLLHFHFRFFGAPTVMVVIADVDECKVNNGGCCKNAKCVNTKGSYYCKCKRGYVGDGYTCYKKKRYGLFERKFYDRLFNRRLLN